jgi:Rv0623-like transcription factor
MASKQKTFVIRSTRAYDLAHKLARQHGCSIETVVERALDDYASTAVAEPKNEPAADFYARMRREYAQNEIEDIDLDAIIRAGCVPHKPVEF